MRASAEVDRLSLMFQDYRNVTGLLGQACRADDDVLDLREILCGSRQKVCSAAFATEVVINTFKAPRRSVGSVDTEPYQRTPASRADCRFQSAISRHFGMLGRAT